MSFEFKVMPTSEAPAALNDSLAPYYKSLILDDDAYQHIKVWAPSDFLLVLLDNDQWVSTLELVDREVLVGDEPVHVCGVSGVMTHPDYQGKGYARRVIRYALDDMRDVLHTQFGLLVCKLELRPFYHSQGWQPIDARLSFNQPDGKASFDPAAVQGMIYPFTPTRWPGGDVDFNGLPF